MQGTSPLLSRLVVSPVSDVLNGTEVKCEDEMTTASSLTAVIDVLLSDDIGKVYSTLCSMMHRNSFNRYTSNYHWNHTKIKS